MCYLVYTVQSFCPVGPNYESVIHIMEQAGGTACRQPHAQLHPGSPPKTSWLPQGTEVNHGTTVCSFITGAVQTETCSQDVVKSLTLSLVNCRFGSFTFFRTEMSALPRMSSDVTKSVMRIWINSILAF